MGSNTHLPSVGFGVSIHAQIPSRAALLWLCCGLFLGACGSEDGPAREPAAAVKIAMLLPGDLFPGWAVELSDAARLAVDEINRNGAMETGKQLRLLVYDYDDALSAATILELLKGDKEIMGLIGPTGVTSTIACLALARSQGWPILNPSSTSLALSTLEDNDYVFRLPPREDAQASVLARYLAQSTTNLPAAPLKRFAILRQDTPYGTALAEQFRAGLDLTSQVVFEASYATHADSESLAVLAQNAIADLPDALYLASDGPDGRAIIHALGELFEEDQTGTFRPRVYVPEQLASNRSLAPHTPKANFVNITGTRPSSVDPQYRLAFERANGKRESAPDPFSAYAYDAVYLLAYAKLMASSQGMDIRHALRNVSHGGAKVLQGEFSRAKQLILSGADIDYDGPSGGFAFDEWGDATTGFYDILESTTKVTTSGSSWSFRTVERVAF